MNLPYSKELRKYPYRSKERQLIAQEIAEISFLRPIFSGAGFIIGFLPEPLPTILKSYLFWDLGIYGLLWHAFDRFIYANIVEKALARIEGTIIGDYQHTIEENEFLVRKLGKKETSVNSYLAAIQSSSKSIIELITDIE